MHHVEGRGVGAWPIMTGCAQRRSHSPSTQDADSGYFHVQPNVRRTDLQESFTAEGHQDFADHHPWLMEIGSDVSAADPLTTVEPVA